MGMPCQVNSILKLSPTQGYPDKLEKGKTYQAQKGSYRIFSIDVPISLVNDEWIAYADAIITKLTWQQGVTTLEFKIDRIYPAPFPAKDQGNDQQ
jgi:hypothetical protein